MPTKASSCPASSEGGGPGPCARGPSYPCAALAQEAQEQDSMHITMDDAIQVVLNHAYGNWDIMLDMVHAQKVEPEERLNPEYYKVSFYIEFRTLRRQTYDYHIRMTNGSIKAHGMGSAEARPRADGQIERGAIPQGARGGPFAST
ncbi:MAG: hypothetical protein Q4B54_07945 [Coriobacteriales bacterium]|nr:hypothetical protein [Coriobacteriales bacterium]